jgi:hypothetical protein
MKINKTYLNRLIKEELEKVLDLSDKDMQRIQQTKDKVLSETERAIIILEDVKPKLIALKNKNEQEDYFHNIPKSHIYEDYKTIEEFRSVGTLFGSSISTVLGKETYDRNTWIGQGHLTPETKAELEFTLFKAIKQTLGEQMVQSAFKYKKDDNYDSMRRDLEKAILRTAGYDDKESALFLDWANEPGLRSARQQGTALAKKLRRSKSGVINIGDRD